MPRVILIRDMPKGLLRRPSCSSASLYAYYNRMIKALEAGEDFDEPPKIIRRR